MTASQLITMTPKQTAAEYRFAYARHQELAQAYADGNTDSETLRSSANYLKVLLAAFQVAKEAARLN